jgi:hypothetical protein
MVRRQRERERQLKRREKQARKAERREAKKARAEEVTPVVADPKKDPMIDWGAAVRETEVVLNEDLEVVAEGERDA